MKRLIDKRRRPTPTVTTVPATPTAPTAPATPTVLATATTSVTLPAPELPAVSTPVDQAFPGPLRGDAQLLLQTRHAQSLFKGRSGDNRPPIVGLLLFGQRLHEIEANALKDDPYADWWLLQIEQGLAEAREMLDGTHAQLKTRLAASLLEVAPAASLAPLRWPLTFSSRLAFRAAELLAAFDQTAVSILTASHLGLLTREEEQRLLNRASTIVRRVFSRVLHYKALGVTRADLEQNTETARTAIERMGTPPEGVLSGRQRATYGPRRTLSLKRRMGESSAPPS